VFAGGEHLYVKFEPSLLRRSSPVPVAVRREREGREQTSWPDPDGGRSVGEIEFGLYLRDARELNVKRRPEACDFVRHVSLEAIGRPTT
jgi:hypothetical protein